MRFLLEGSYSDSDETPIFSYAYRYDDFNRRTHSTLVNGNYWQYEYDAMEQVTGTWKKRADDSQIPGWAYGYAFDSMGNRTEASVNGATTSYAPDSLNQYDSFTVPRVVDIFGEAPLNLSMSANGTPLARDGEAFYGQLDFTGAKPASRPHRAVVSVAGTLAGAGDEGRDTVREERGARYFPPAPYEPTYDADGNLLDDGRWAYTWNADNRLVEMETHRLAVAAGVRREKLEFRYDSQGRRFEKRSYHWNPQSGDWEAVAHRLYVYDGWNLLAEFDALSSDLSLETTYTWGLDLSGTWQGAGGVGGLLCVYDAATGAASAPYTDGNGNVMGYADTTSGAIVAEYEYGPFGEPVIAKGTKAGEFSFRFSTKFTDAETGLLYYGYRYYDPDAGRWLSRDPLGEEGGINLYGFVGNDGINEYDYLGLQYAPTPQDCARMLAELLAKVGKLITNYHKYDPIPDGKGGFPWRHGGRTGVTRPGGHYDKIKQLQRGIKNDVKNYIDLCRGGNGGCPIGKPVPKGVDGWANKPIPLPVVPISWITYVTDDQIQIAKYVSWSASGAGAVVIIYATGGTAAPFLAPIFLPAVNP